MRIFYRSYRGIPPLCSVTLHGEEKNISEVERILLNEQEVFRLKKGDEENTKISVLGSEGLVFPLKILELSSF